MRRAVAVIAFALASTAALADESPPSRFGFAVPDGWTDLSPGAPSANFEKAVPALAEMIRARPMAFYAFELGLPNDDGFVENVNAKVVRGAAPITAAAVAESFAAVDRELRAAGGRYESLEQSTVDINGVTVGRAVGVMRFGAIVSKQLAYIMPGDNQTAIVTYSSTEEAFARYLPTFEAAARKTTGLRTPTTFWGNVLRSAGRGALLGGIASFIVVTAIGLARWRRKRPGRA